MQVLARVIEKPKFDLVVMPQSGTVSRGLFSGPFDTIFGKYSLANDRYQPTRGWEVKSPPGIHMFGFELAKSPMVHRFDMLAEALFLGGKYRADRPRLPFTQYTFDGKVYRNERDPFVAIHLAHRARGIRGLLKFGARMENNRVYVFDPELFVKGREGKGLLLTLVELNSKIGIFEIDPMYWVYMILENQTSVPKLPRHPTRNWEELPNKSIGVLHGTFKYLCKHFGITDATLQSDLHALPPSSDAK